MATKKRILTNPDFVIFCETRNIKSETVNFTTALQKYTNLIGKSLDELIDEADKEEDMAIRLRKRKIRGYLLNFKKHLEDS